MIARSYLILWALRLQWPPFSWLFRFYYRLAIRCSRFLISRLEGVRGIYLSGSWVRRDVIYGLSDIDFKIFVAGEKNQEIYQTIRRRFQLLRRIFPMLGSPDEKGVYFIQSFEADYIHYPLVQHFFDARFFSHQLLWGEDVIARLPLKSWKELDQAECFWARLKDWIERVHRLADSEKLSRLQKRHLLFKAVADVALLAVRTDSPEAGPFHRTEILRRICPEMEEPYRRFTENLISEHRSGYREQRNSMDDAFRLFKKMVALCSERIFLRDDSAPLNLEPAMQPCEDGDPAIADRLRAISPGIGKVSVVRWPQMPLNPFDFHLFNAPAILLECSEPLGLDELHALKVYFGQSLSGKAALLLREFPQFVSSVDAELVEQWGGFHGSPDLLHACLAPSERHPCTRLFRARIFARIRAFREQLADTLARPEFGRLELRVFPFFLFNCLRVLIFAREFHQGKWLFPVTPSETADYLNRRTTLSPEFTLKLLAQFEMASRNGGSFNERLIPKSRSLLAQMLEISRNGKGWEPLEKLNSEADERYLVISAAVLTANRPSQLERCLRSLADLSRPPDELIVVDDGRDSAAQGVVEAFQAAYPVRYLRSGQSGVASARNVAAQAAMGDVIAFLDDDACAAPDWLERLERIFLRDPQIGLSSGSILNMESGRRDLVSRFMEAAQKIQS